MNGRATTERIRSRSIQHNPISIISGAASSIAVRRKNLFKSSTQDDLMASLEFMNSLAADLPSGHNNNNKGSNSGPLWLTATSPLKRSHTVQARRIVKIGSGNVSVVKPPNQFLPQQQQQNSFSANEVMRKPPLPKLSLASPASTSTSFAMSVPVQQQQQQQQQQQHFPSHFVVLPPNASGGTYYRNNNSFINSNLTPTVKAILSPSVCEQVYWPQQQQQIQQQQQQMNPQPQHVHQETHQQPHHYNQYHHVSSPRPSRPTELFVRDIPYSEPRQNHRVTNEPEPPVPPRSSSEGPSCSDTPPPLPVRKFRRVYTTNDVIQRQEELYARP